MGSKKVWRSEYYIFFDNFFFQAEDGIRVFGVTGVQSCALPICVFFFAFYRVFWNEYYLSSQYPQELFPVPFELPIIQDPALPTHNVAADLEDWEQFRKEVKHWVLTLGR